MDTRLIGQSQGVLSIKALVMGVQFIFEVKQKEGIIF